MVSYRLGYLWPRVRGPGGTSNCQLEVAGIAGTSTPSEATSDWQLGISCLLRNAVPQERPKAGGFRPQPQVVANTSRRLKVRIT